MRALLFALTLLLVVPTASAEVPTRQNQRAAVLAILEAQHPRFDGPSLRRIGPDVETLLIEYATIASVASPVRLRALGALQFFPSTATRAVLQEVLASRDPEVAVLRVALSAFAAGFGIQALPVLQAHLQHSNVFIREAAAYALGDIDDPRVTSTLENRLQHEPSVAVRDAIMAALQRINRRK